MADDKQKLTIGKDDELAQETKKCAASDDTKYVEVVDAIIKDDEFQPLLESFAPKELDMSKFSYLFDFDGPNKDMFIDSIKEIAESFVPNLDSIEYDTDNFYEDEIFGFGSESNEELESLLAYFAPVEDLNFVGIFHQIFDGSNHPKRTTPTDTSKDIQGMVSVGLKRGDIRRDQLEKTASGGAEKIVKLAYFYKIPLRSSVVEKVRLQSDTLTFVRAIICFPHFASVILFEQDAFVKNGVESVLASERLPKAMKHVGFCGLIPKSCDPDLMKAYVYAHAAYMVDLSKLVNADDKRSLKEMVVSQVECSKAGVNYNLIPYDDEFRVGNLRDVGLTDAGVLKKIVDVCNNVCKVVGEPELDYATVEKNHIKNGIVCFFEDENKDVAAGKLAKGLADKN